MHIVVLDKIFRLKATAKQREFFNSTAQAALFCGGVGSGKTTIGALWILNKALCFPKAVGFIGANTYLQLHKATLPPFFGRLDQRQIDWVINRKPPPEWGVSSRFRDHENVITLSNGAQILVYSLENYQAYRGIQAAYAWIDETRDSRPEAFDILLERLRGFDDIYPDITYELRVTTTPNGFDWLWRKFVNPATKLPHSDYVTASSYDNTFLPHSYARDLEAKLGRNLARQQIYAEFLNLATGRAFAFNRARHVRNLTFDPLLPLIYSMDFNVSPMCAAVMQANRATRTVNVLDEIIIPDNAQTRDCCREFARRWKRVTLPGGEVWRPNVEIFGDLAGKHRDTRGAESDWSIMLRTIREAFNGCAHEASDGRQRLVADGIQAVNALLDPAQGEPLLTVNPACQTLILDFEQVAFKPGTRELDKRNRHLTHISDAVRYPVAQLFPVVETKIGGLD